MQNSSFEVSAQSQNIEIHESPSQELLEEVSAFVRAEANWIQNLFDLAITKPTFAVVRGANNEIIGTSSIHELSPHNYWLGNVCVATSARRRGLASTIVSAILSHASEKKSRSHIVLLASKLGEGVYRRLGFTDVDNINVSLYKRPVMPPPNRSTSAPSLPNEKEHEDAIRLEKEASGQYRGQLLNALFQKDRLCAILKSESSVVAAAWGRYMAPNPSTNLPALQIGPVVAKSPDFAISVIAELLRMDQATHSDSRDTCVPTSALEVHRGKNEANKLVFESLGFVELMPVPYMQKGLVSSAESRPTHLDLVSANEQYRAAIWWDIA